MRIVKAYLDVERLRLGDKLKLEIDVTPEAQTVLIPILSIQPLVENAVKHGIAPQAGGGLIQIHAGLDAQGSLLISVRDSGPGFSEATAAEWVLKTSNGDWSCVTAATRS